MLSFLRGRVSGHRYRTAVPLLLGAVLLGAVLGGGGYAYASGTSFDNPWVFRATNQASEGLRIQSTGGPNGQLLIVYDNFNQPIFAVNKAGGASVFGDNFNVHQGGDIFHPWVRLSVVDPRPADCVTTGQLVIGGSATSGGRIWRCVVGRGWLPVL
ncbi:hypothetical protein FF36_04630 [Frankia torreyi]|uniref:Uncharacterized protein n=1 Tax=Frankia torreyi TaxID=1856 RepID=A0A0D8BA19_9ACTN|nr:MULTISPECIES: hypothetical protein [Frankia]KJE21036.1 hypothetical protein FF36_04630 [Frankia torreyi]KQC39647.1 hypothetical protein UK82_03040 [Frankia sp. ACN1ag]KQM04087.1 hypothetical protein FF86_103010 [Frankia sp. CpI1-P]